MPEVIEAEIKTVLLAAGREAVESVQRRFRDIDKITGKQWRYEVPSEQELQGAIGARLINLENLLERVEVTLEHTRSALRRVYEGSPPNGPKNQQFKDSMIWEAALDLGQQYEVHFVTADTGFYRDKDKPAIATELGKECEQRNVSVHIYSSLDACLSALRAEMPPIDHNALATAAFAAAKPELDEYAEHRAIQVMDMRKHNVKPYLTGDPDVLSLSFQLTADGIDMESPSLRADIRVTAEGSCAYSISTGEANGALLDQVIYDWTDETGQRHLLKSVFARIGEGIRLTANAPLDD
jgi:hypothetical protein